MPLEEAARVEPRDSGFGRLFAECWFSLTIWERDEILLPRRMLFVELVVVGAPLLLSLVVWEAADYDVEFNYVLFKLASAAGTMAP